ncbi:hypothetical protein NE237_029278 [Protea cynaroides]|uniref:Uncharacterized protein n=1 Tax=Protea cynaroides TaxID=273540 RepID=A0A9Q0GQV7_9MAGN|nr:hypothetical protein NE237_029278 [Protea cynaroides]
MEVPAGGRVAEIRKERGEDEDVVDVEVAMCQNSPATAPTRGDIADLDAIPTNNRFIALGTEDDNKAEEDVTSHDTIPLVSNDREKETPSSAPSMPSILSAEVENLAILPSPALPPLANQTTSQNASLSQTLSTYSL